MIELCDLSEIGKKKLCKDCKYKMAINGLLICSLNYKPSLFAKTENEIYCREKAVNESK